MKASTMVIVSCKPSPQEYPEPYAGYVDLVDEVDMLAALDTQIDETRSVIATISEVVANEVHAPYTWSIKQVIGHCIDAERVFAYRALRFAVNDPAELPGFDENFYVAESDYTQVTLDRLLEELLMLRSANLAMFRRFKPESWSNMGTASGNQVSVRALSAILVGHLRHHLDIIRKRVGC
jgi:hypothetical protein